MSKSLPLVQLQVLTPLLIGLRQHGVDPEPVLDSVGLTLDAVEQDNASVHVMVIHQFVENCAKAAGDTTFCAKIGSQLASIDWPMIRVAFAQAKTLGDFLNIYATQASLVASSVTVFVEVRGDTVTFGETRKFKPLIQPAQNDGFMIGLKLAILEQALGDRMEPERVILVLCDPSVLPRNFAQYQSLQGNSMGPRIQFPSDWLSLPISGADTKTDVPKPSRDNRQDGFLSGLRLMLNQQIGKGGLKAEDVADLLHTNKRKLARQLAKLGTSVSHELLRAKMDYAKAALRKSEQPIDEIAAALGYSDPSNFARAFAKVEKLTPTQYQAEHR